MKTAIVIVCLLVLVKCDEKIIDEYENLINGEIEKALKFELPKDASEYKPTQENPVEDVGTFDFIIVGGGTTGSVLANRLSKISKWKILLLEAGKFGNNFTDIPSMDTLLRASEYNWGFKSIKQTTACLDFPNQECPYDRGKGIGGSSLINGLVYSRGNRHDFDLWSSMGNPGWSYDELFPYFKLSENFVKTDENVTVDYDYHRSGGELNVEYHLPRNDYVTRFIEANKELGYRSVDYNGKHQIGASPTQINTRNGRRDHSGNAFIEPIKDIRANLKIMTESYVTKILINDNKTVYGVIFANGGKYCEAYVNFEVILSAGVFGSAQLLMLSGIGPKHHLEELEIPLVQDLGVGVVLRDHPKFSLGFTTNQTEIETPLRVQIAEYLNGYGSLTDANSLQGVGFYKTSLEESTIESYPDLELIMTPFYGTVKELTRILNNANEKLWLNYDPSVSFYINIVALHTKSSGSVKLKSKNSFDYPVIDSRYLSDPGDRDIGVMYEGIKLAIDLINSSPFREVNASVKAPHLEECADKTYLSKEYWFCVLRRLTGDIYHPAGTCQMGLVVNPEAKVFGVEGLRVADASVIPLSISGHPSAVCVMIGEKISDLIKSEYVRIFEQ